MLQDEGRAWAGFLQIGNTHNSGIYWSFQEVQNSVKTTTVRKQYRFVQADLYFRVLKNVLQQKEYMLEESYMYIS